MCPEGVQIHLIYYFVIIEFFIIISMFEGLFIWVFEFVVLDGNESLAEGIG
jgi:hypothetical protein